MGCLGTPVAALSRIMGAWAFRNHVLPSFCSRVLPSWKSRPVGGSRQEITFFLLLSFCSRVFPSSACAKVARFPPNGLQTMVGQGFALHHFAKDGDRGFCLSITSTEVAKRGFCHEQADECVVESMLDEARAAMASPRFKVALEVSSPHLPPSLSPSLSLSLSLPPPALSVAISLARAVCVCVYVCVCVCVSALCVCGGVVGVCECVFPSLSLNISHTYAHTRVRAHGCTHTHTHTHTHTERERERERERRSSCRECVKCNVPPPPWCRSIRLSADERCMWASCHCDHLIDQVAISFIPLCTPFRCKPESKNKVLE
jgi:hypothetical protein